MHFLKDYNLLQSVVLLSFFTVAVVFVAYICSLFHEPQTPAGLPWIGRRKERLSYVRARIRMLTGFKDVLLEAVEHHKRGYAVVCPMPIGPPQVILPPKELYWMITQPATVVSQDPLVNSVHEFLGSGLDGDLSFAELLRKNLTRNDERVPVLYEEISNAFDHLWGTLEEWKVVDLRSSLRMVNARVANRIFVGLPLCRDETYLGHIMGFTNASGIGTAIYPLIPWILVAPVSALIKAINRRYIRKCSEYLIPAIRKRFIEVGLVLGGKEPKNVESQPPDNLLTWMVTRSIQRGEDVTDIDAKLVSRLVVANLPAIEASTHTLWKSVVDLLLLADRDKHLVPAVNEATSNLQGCHFSPKKKDVDELGRIEKAIKETLRRESLVGLNRQITALDGVDRAGAHLPHGTRVCISAVGLHFDESKYANANEYDPCREEAKGSGGVDSIRTSPARATESYLAFGFGRRACPGRFLVTEQMKLIIAHMFVKYDVEVVKGKDPNVLEKIRIRHKPETK